MPADRSLADGLGDGIVSTYDRLRTLVVLTLARRLRASLAGDDDPGSTVRRLIRALDRGLERRAQDAVEKAAARGTAEADRELRPLGRTPTPREREQAASQALDLANTLRATHPRIVAWAQASYRATVLAAETERADQLRRVAAQRAWERLIARGITGYTDRAGRNWDLSSYVEMATRTRLAEAATTAHLDRLGDAGLDLVVVSNAPQECSLCRPWEGQVLARTGAGARDLRVEHATQDRDITVRVAGSVAEAMAAGLMHPNCRHSLSAYLPGVTKPPTRTADPEGDAARQRQRAIERQIRAWRLREQAALTDQARGAAAVFVRKWQAQMRTHLAAHPELRRQTAREQVGEAR